MFSKTNLISTLVTGLWAFLGGWLLWGMLGDPLLKDHVVTPGIMKPEPDMVHLIIGCFVMAFAFSTIYSKWARGHHSVSQGLQYGLWLGILSGLGEGLIDYSTANLVDITGTFINAVIYIVFYGIMGALASVIYGKYAAKEA